DWHHRGSRHKLVIWGSVGKLSINARDWTMPQGTTSLAERADLAFQRTRELRAEFEGQRARARAECEHAREIVPHIQALIEALQLQPTIRPSAFWHAIELSDRYGSLEERTSILLLADAFFKANREFWNIATRRDEPANAPYPAPTKTRTTPRLVSLK